MTDFATRFAPSPTGYLHRGHAFSAINAWIAAREAGGRFHLRIEDIDRGRCRKDFEDAILADLRWLGLDWHPPLIRQSERLAIYRDHIGELADRGLLYRCFRTRREVAEMLAAPHSRTAAFVGEPLPAREESRRLADGQSFAWRLSMIEARRQLGPKAFDALTFEEHVGQRVLSRPARATDHGDVVLGRKDIGASYHLSSVVDDIALGITHVVRGADLVEAAGFHRLLYALLDASPPIYRHHRLIRDETGRRLAKRLRSETLRSMRANGTDPETLRNELTALQVKEIMTPNADPEWRSAGRNAR